MSYFREEDNPYTLQFSYIPPRFIERQAITSFIINNYVRKVPTYRGMFITGVRGSGKTVMLGDIRNKINAMEDWIAVDINPEDDLIHSVANKLYRIPEIKSLFIKAKIDLSIMGLGVKVENAELVAYSDDDALEMMLEVLKKKNRKVLVTIDEITYSDNVARFSHALSSYANADYDIYVLMTGLKENIDRIKNKPSLTFLYRAKVNEIEMLNITAISADYQKTLKLDTGEADRLAFESKGYSLAYQAIGYVYWNAYSRSAELTQSQIKDIYNELDSILAEFAYDKIFEELSAKDIEVLRAIASLIRESDDESDIVKVADVRNKVNMSSATFATYRERLINDGILDGKIYGCLRFSLPRLENYVRLR
ncbi:MAG: hypothetical protein IJS12_10070 [Lachnospiraceae bacterium]|nr:hypothetical protein [Lachnospiraceae bacterium]